MTLLIVDDEDLTRGGIAAAIRKTDLPIKRILEADDGVRGVDTALAERPDIILSDIRMSRMSGIDMVDSLKEKLPDTVFIFMSGYSDREYLKEAIRLKAVSFIEKPVDLKELEGALKEAICLRDEIRQSRQSKLFESRAAAGRLALSLTLPPEEAGELSTELTGDEVSNRVRSNRFITTFIVKATVSLDTLGSDEKKRINDSFDVFLESIRCGEINIIKHDQYLVYHIFSPEKLTEKNIRLIGGTLKDILGDKLKFFISAGNTVSGLENAWSSYNQAVLLMQSSFFKDYGCIIYDSNEELLPAPRVLPDPSDAYLLSLLSGDPEKVRRTEEEIERSLSDSRNLLPNQVRDIYYKLFTAVSDAYRKLSIPPDSFFSTSESLLSFVQECNTLRELSGHLSERSLRLLESMDNKEPENPTVFSIREYVSKNYSREDLSVKEISGYVHLSSAYVCTLFKNETGTTLNQYITLYRMDKAKEFLSDPAYTISEISMKVGYSDGNYFGKSFKKNVGMTPGEYRAHILL